VVHPLDDPVELRCPFGRQGGMFAKLTPVDGVGTIEVTCRGCLAERRRTIPMTLAVMHEFDLRGRHVETTYV
jgi:hypothetical protein